MGDSYKQKREAMLRQEVSALESAAGRDVRAPLTEAQRKEIIKEIRLGRYYRKKSIAARYGVNPSYLWKLEEEEGVR